MLHNNCLSSINFKLTIYNDFSNTNNAIENPNYIPHKYSIVGLGTLSKFIK